jgi:hypothetical protein
MSLVNVAANADGTRATLRIQGESNDPLPAFSGTVEWGQIQGTTESYQEVNVKNQLFTAPASVLAPSDVDIPLQLKRPYAGTVRLYPHSRYPARRAVTSL